MGHTLRKSIANCRDSGGMGQYFSELHVYFIRGDAWQLAYTLDYSSTSGLAGHIPRNGSSLGASGTERINHEGQCRSGFTQ